MSKITFNNRLNKIYELLKIVKLDIHIVNDDNKIEFVIKKVNGKNKKYYYYTVNFSFKNILSPKFDRYLAHYCCHEIAHHIVASKNRRSKYDYGLLNKSKLFTHFEECKVIAVHNFLLMKFKFVPLNDNVFFNMGKFIKGNESKLNNWWNIEGRLLAKTYFELI